MLVSGEISGGRNGELVRGAALELLQHAQVVVEQLANVRDVPDLESGFVTPRRLSGILRSISGVRWALSNPFGIPYGVRIQSA
jgi:hypothetical protein